MHVLLRSAVRDDAAQHSLLRPSSDRQNTGHGLDGRSVVRHIRAGWHRRGGRTLIFPAESSASANVSTPPTSPFAQTQERIIMDTAVVVSVRRLWPVADHRRCVGLLRHRAWHRVWRPQGAEVAHIAAHRLLLVHSSHPADQSEQKSTSTTHHLLALSTVLDCSAGRVLRLLHSQCRGRSRSRESPGQ